MFIGFCVRGDVLEFSAADANLGTAFYTLDQEPIEKPRLIVRSKIWLIRSSCHTG